jgi:hypothetical protein
MTTLGKVLVFVNLIFSLAVGYLGIMSFTARTHWAKATEEYKKNVEISQASNQALAAQMTKVQQDSGAEVSAANKRVEEGQKELTDVRGRLTALGNELNQQKAALQQSQASFQAAQEEARRRQQDVVAMQGTVKQLTDERQKLVQSTADMRDAKVAAEIEATTLRRRNEQLEGELRAIAKELQNAKRGGTSPSGAQPTTNPPPEDVEGRVVTADPSGYLRLSIGSDSGLAKGHTLELFRLSPPKYLGRVRVVEVTPHESVAQPVGRPTDKPVPGDKVRSRLSNGGS